MDRDIIFLNNKPFSNYITVNVISNKSLQLAGNMSRRIIVSLFALGAITSVLAEPQLQSDAPDQISVATSSDEDTTSDLAIVQNSFDFWFHEMRHEGSGLACDNIRTDWKAICNQGWLEDDTNNGNKFSLASTGWTIIILTVGAELFAKTNGKAGLERGKAAAEVHFCFFRCTSGRFCARPELLLCSMHLVWWYTEYVIVYGQDKRHFVDTVFNFYSLNTAKARLSIPSDTSPDKAHLVPL